MTRFLHLHSARSRFFRVTRPFLMAVRQASPQTFLRLIRR